MRSSGAWEISDNGRIPGSVSATVAAKVIYCFFDRRDVLVSYIDLFRIREGVKDRPYPSYQSHFLAPGQEGHINSTTSTLDHDYKPFKLSCFHGHGYIHSDFGPFPLLHFLF